MYQIGICDDEPIFLQNAAELTKKVLDSHGILCSVRTFECLDELRWYLDRDHGSLDLLLLDNFQRLLAVGSFKNLISLRGQVQPQRPPDIRVVITNQNMIHPNTSGILDKRPTFYLFTV